MSHGHNSLANYTARDKVNVSIVNVDFMFRKSQKKVRETRCLKEISLF